MDQINAVALQAQLPCIGSFNLTTLLRVDAIVPLEGSVGYFKLQ